MTPEQSLEKFSGIVNQDRINLAHAALILATDEYPDLDLARYLDCLDEMAEAVRPRVSLPSDAHDTLAQLNQYLFQEMRFHGNREDYYDPRNSYLNDVLDRRVGLPITLAVVYLEVAQRLGLPIYGVGLPGHFIVKWSDAKDEIFLDPFNEGQILNADGLRRLIRDTFQRDATLQSEWLQAIDAKYILLRMLSNLRGIFLYRQRMDRALTIMEKILVLEPRSAESLRDAGVIAYRTQHYRRAAGYFEKYLAYHSDSAEAEKIRSLAHAAWTEATRMN